jgi:hypothetical protein
VILRELAKALPTLAKLSNLLDNVHTSLGSFPEQMRSGSSRPSPLLGPSDSAHNDIASPPEPPNRPTRLGMCLRPEETARIES